MEAPSPGFYNNLKVGRAQRYSAVSEKSPFS
jgi:hypothetical protein